MPVNRSHFASSAARTALLASTLRAAADPAARLRCAGSCLQGCPGRADKQPRASVSCRRASGVRRSLSQKKAASARRGRITRSLPSRTWSGSLLFDVGDGDKVGNSCHLVGNRKVALVTRQRRNNDLTRQLQDTARRSAGHRHGPLDQRGDLIVQRLAVDNVTARLRLRRYALFHQLRAAIKVGDDRTLLLQRSKIVGRLMIDWLRTMKAMTAGLRCPPPCPLRALQ